MSNNTSWDIDKYRVDHESEEQWQLRRKFMETWKDDYTEERLVCLAQVFANIEFMGCRYPMETMQEVARLSKEVANDYRKHKKTKLQRTFVSASDAAEDRAKGIKREGGVIKDTPPQKSKRIEFVPQGRSEDTDDLRSGEDEIQAPESSPKQNDTIADEKDDERHSKVSDSDNRECLSNYTEKLERMSCIDVCNFRENMFITPFGRFIYVVRPWASKLSNIQASSQACNLALVTTYKDAVYSLTLNGVLLAEASGSTKAIARSTVELLAWNRLTGCAITLMIKEQFRAHGDKQISMSDVSGRREEFGTPVENTVALKMMKMMGWKGGGLGADAQGIEEPIKPHLQMVNRAGLGSSPSDIRQLKRCGIELMKRFIASDVLDVDLIFSSEFSKEERAALHQCAQRVGLASRSYGDTDRFLVVKKKLNPFSVVRAVVEKGGDTPKYKVYLPASLGAKGR